MMDTQQQPPTEAPPPSDTDRLRRLSAGKMLGGVATGVAERFDLPLWLVRLGFIFLAIPGGIGFALYGAMWLLLPRDDQVDPPIKNLLAGTDGNVSWVGVAFIGVAALIIISSIPFVSGEAAWALVLVVLGFLLYRGDIGLSPRSGPDTPVDSDSTPGDAPDGPSDGTGGIGHGDGGGPTTPPPPMPPAASMAATAPVPPAPPKPPKPPSVLAPLTIAVGLIALGTMAFFDYALATFDPMPRHYLALALGITGIGLLVGSVMGRARGLIALGVLLVPALVVSPLAEIDLATGIGERRYAPATVEEIADRYDLGIGSLQIDLRNVDFAPGDEVEFEAGVGIGELVVILPEGVAYTVDSSVGVGSIDGVDRDRDGVGAELQESAAGENGSVTITTDVGIGEVDIERYGAESQVPILETTPNVIVADSPSTLDGVYDFGLADVVFDLADYEASEAESVQIDLGSGTVTIIVPADLALEIDAEVGFGSITAFGSETSGIERTFDLERSGENPLRIEVSVGAGEIIFEEDNQ